MIRTLVTVLAGLLGLAFGSFLNVCLSRWPEGESIVHPRSHCRHCEHTLAWWENVPVVSWLFLSGRCRGCRAWIGLRYPLVELAVGVLWAWATWSSSVWAFDPEQTSLTLSVAILRIAGSMIFYWLSVALAFLDAEHLWLPNLLTLPGTALGLLAFFLPESMQRFRGAFYPRHPGLTESLIERILAILVAAGFVLLIRWIYWLVRHREGMGLGDVKLMAMLAAWLGLPATMLAFFIGAMLGAIAGVIVIAFPSTRDDGQDWATTKLPFGTFLCIGGVISGLWGERMISAYLHFIGL